MRDIHGAPRASSKRLALPLPAPTPILGYTRSCSTWEQEFQVGFECSLTQLLTNCRALTELLVSNYK